MLRLLSPIELAGVFESDIDLEGAALDAVQESAEALLEEMYPDTAYELLADWERVYDIVPADGATLQSRRDAVVEKMRARGGLSRAYFIGLAAMHGWIITIDEMRAFTAGVSRCGDRLYVPGVRWIWRVNVGSQAIYRFRAGESTAGERLTWWVPNTELEDLLTELKPAHTAVIFNYT
jgi:uncharacterized protein YmfQ (DUF2313 family)